MRKEPNCRERMFVNGQIAADNRRLNSFGLQLAVGVASLVIEYDLQKFNFFTFRLKLKVLFLILLQEYSTVPGTLPLCAGQYYILFPEAIQSVVRR